MKNHFRDWRKKWHYVLKCGGARIIGEMFIEEDGGNYPLRATVQTTNGEISDERWTVSGTYSLETLDDSFDLVLVSEADAIS